MEKIKYIPLCLFFAFTLKILFMGVSHISDPAIILILALMSAFYEYKATDAKLKTLENKLDSHLKEFAVKNKELDDVKTAVASVKIASGMRNVSSR